MKAALSIAGSDSGAGAGIQADLKTFSALGVYGCTAITAITAQNTRRVYGIAEVSSDMIKRQIRTVLDDFSPGAIKIGMVYSREAIETVGRTLSAVSVPIVLDPIVAAGTGARLLQEDALESLASTLLPLCTLVTPNRMEAELLAGARIGSEQDAIGAAESMRAMGAKNVIVKGGHFSTKEVTDFLVTSSGQTLKLKNPRVDIGESHGSGCNFSAAATAFLALGFSLEESCRRANRYVHEAIAGATRIGRGLPVTNPLALIYVDAMRYRVAEELKIAVAGLCALQDCYRLIPETQTNFCYALPDPQGAQDVAGVSGRIVRVGQQAKPSSGVEFGASKHVASAIISCMAVRPEQRSAINIRYDAGIAKACRANFEVSSYDRSSEPTTIKRKEGSTISWGISQALSKKPSADVVYHTGDVGKEAMVIIFGRSPADVLAKVEMILNSYQ